MKKYAGLLGVLFLGFALMQGCADSCDNVQDDPVGGEYFTVEYLTPTGDNYLQTKYNAANVVVYLDSTGGNNASNLKLIFPGYADGKFGPFAYTEKYINGATGQVNSLRLVGKPYSYKYYIKKDTFGQDTLSVDFLLSVDECHEYWAYIRYSLNGSPLPQYDGQRQANIVVVE